jgi:hypothetical protein
MKETQFPYYIEDWILWLGRKKNEKGNDIDFPFWTAWPIKLANYDVTFITRSGDSIRKEVGFTALQVDMAVKIVTKYRRQIMSKLAIDVQYIGIDKPTRLEIRKVDRSYTVSSRKHHYEIRYPYQPNLVDSMHKAAINAAGEFWWNKTGRCWVVEKTERNLSIIYEFIKSNNGHNWHLDKETTQHFSDVDTTYNNIYAHIPHIELSQDNKLVVVNSNPSLDTALSTFDFDNDLPNAVFRADIYGLSIGPQLKDHIFKNYKDIATAITMPQCEAFRRSKVMDTHLQVSNLKQFMTTIRPKYWVFLSFGKTKLTVSSTIQEIAINIDTDAEKIFFPVQTSNVESVRSFFNDLRELTTSEIVMFTDNTLLTYRLWPMLESIQLLRLIYLHGDNNS